MAVSSHVPFDCSLYDDQDDDLVVMPCIDDGPTWPEMWSQIYESLILFTSLILVSNVAGRAYNGVWGGARAPAWLLRYVGTRFRAPRDKSVELAMDLAQLAGSGLLVWTWVRTTYTWRADENRLDLAGMALCVVSVMYRHLQQGFNWRYASTWLVFLDCLTLPPVAMLSTGLYKTMVNVISTAEVLAASIPWLQRFNFGPKSHLSREGRGSRWPTCEAFTGSTQ
jgi:hypothetical protein